MQLVDCVKQTGTCSGVTQLHLLSPVGRVVFIHIYLKVEHVESSSLIDEAVERDTAKTQHI